MENQYLTYPKGIVEDVLVKVDKFISLVDFVVLDMEEDTEAPLILDRPFLATTQVLIDVKYGELPVRVGEEHVKFNLYQSMKLPYEYKASCMRIDSLIPSKSELIYDFMSRDPLEDCLTISLSVKELNCDKIIYDPELVETILSLEENEKTFDIQEEQKNVDGLVLNALPRHLRYAFLGDNDIKPMILSTNLSKEMEHRVLGGYEKEHYYIFSINLRYKRNQSCDLYA